LQQGDLLKRTDDLNAVVTKYHPYYAEKKDYTHFLVLTQSCDLVRRDGDECGCAYINLAVVRPLEFVLNREADAYRRTRIMKRINGVSNKDRNKLDMFLHRLLNNNEKDYFYLHEETTVGIYSSCAFLRLSIAIRADEHYRTCQEARIASLKTEFQSKLGWLVGYVFARVGTMDWERPALLAMVKKILKENIIWLDEDKIRAANISDEEIDALPPEELVKRIEAAKVSKKKEQVIAAILTELQAGEFVRTEDVEKIKVRLRGAETVSALLKN
jgi:hypothetical protein